MKSSNYLHVHLVRHLRKWHRKFGIIAAFFLIFLSLSGIALNHTDTLSLAHSPIKSTWLLDHYGILAPNDVRFYDNNINVTNNLVWLNERLLLESDTKVVGIVPITIMGQKAFAVVNTGQLYLYSQRGELIDQLGQESGFPVSANAVTLIDGMLVIKSDIGLLQFHSEQYFWQDVRPVKKFEWLMPNKVSEQKIDTAKLNYRAQYLTLERIILDAHSGRIFGIFGVLFMDAVAILLILLSLSGIYIWIRHAKTKG